MKNIQKPESFDAVGFMRQRRDELSDLYEKSPDIFWKQLEEIRKKYGDKFHQLEVPMSDVSH
jgi:hypothetical protein